MDYSPPDPPKPGIKPLSLKSPDLAEGFLTRVTPGNPLFSVANPYIEMVFSLSRVFWQSKLDQSSLNMFEKCTYILQSKKHVMEVNNILFKQPGLQSDSYVCFQFQKKMEKMKRGCIIFLRLILFVTELRSQ